MWVQVNQVIRAVDDKTTQNWVNVDMIERVHPSGIKTGTTLHLQSGLLIDVVEDMGWWKEKVAPSDHQT